ncbi:hypothetical protein C8F04DRAFT_56523 [Mycena alexandri]|uniref:Uncharacterized protein n=1 Tax=Mycena alexandri TaxID=1745969 RepID=A0AAD6XF20_9AGAR|nr:hypothetical protein C8F04DRAFT_56523 [Mycena alexandri]
MTATVSPALPPELEREIFELCAHSWPAQIPKLMRVAHRVKHWVHPLLYRTLVVYDPSRKNPDDAGTRRITIERAASAIGAHPAFFPSAVRHLLVYTFHNKDVANIATILAACTGIENLSLFEMDDTWISIIALLPLKRFYGRCQILISMPHPSNIVFPHLTHLRLIDWIHSENTDALIAFLAYPCSRT